MATQPGKLNGTPTAFSFDKLMQTKFEPMRWILDGLIPEGTILVAGKPKSGKSWFTLNLLLCAVSGGTYLGRRVRQCGALYLSLEDNERRLQTRMRVLLEKWGDTAGLENLKYRCEWPSGAAGAKLLGEYLDLHPHTRIVAVDVLKCIRERDSGTRNSYDLDYEVTEPWRRIATERRITLIFVHHTRKASAEDVFDEISGTLGLSGGVDQLIVMKRTNSVSSTKRSATLHVRGRDLEEDHALALEMASGWWTLVGDATEITMHKSRREVIQIIQERGPLSPTQIMEITGKSSLPSTHHLLSRMVSDGLLTNNSGVYCCAAHKDSQSLM